MPGRLEIGLLVFAVAAALFLLSVAPVGSMPGFLLLSLVPQAPRRLLVEHAGLCLCVPLLFLTLLLFHLNQEPLLVIGLWLFGIVAAVGLAWSADSAPRFRRLDLSPAWTRNDWLALLAVVLVAALLRFWAINELPGVYEDEASHLADSYRVIDGLIRTPFESLTWSEGAFFDYILAGLLKAGLEPGFSLKLMGVVPGVATVGITYVFLRRVFDAPLAFFGAAFLAVSSWHLITTRWGYVQSFDGMLVALLVLFLIRGLQSGSRLDYALAGLMAGFTLSLSKSMMPVVLITGATMIALFVRMGWRALLRDYGEGFLLLILVALMVFAPRGLYILENPDVALARPREVFLFDGDNWPELKQQPLEQTGNNLINLVGGLNVKAGSEPRWNVHRLEPTLDLVSGGLVVLGFAFALFHARRWQFALLLLWAAAVLLPASTALALDDDPVMYRISSLMPVVYALVAVPIWLAWRQQESVTGKRVVLAGGVILLAVSAYLNVTAYFGDYRNDQQVFISSGQVDTRVAAAVRGLAPGRSVYLTTSQVYQPVVDLLTRGITYHELNLRDQLLDIEPGSGPLAFVLVRSGRYADGKLADDLLRALRARYPRGHLQESGKDPEGSVIYDTYVVDR